MNRRIFLTGALLGPLAAISAKSDGRVPGISQSPVREALSGSYMVNHRHTSSGPFLPRHWWVSFHKQGSFEDEGWEVLERDLDNHMALMEYRSA